MPARSGTTTSVEQSRRVPSDRARERDGRHRCPQLEIYFGPFERTVSLPHNIAVDRERLTANYRDGFLVVLLPKLGSERPALSRKIPVTADNSLDGVLEESESEEAS